MIKKNPLITSGKLGMNATFDRMRIIFNEGRKSYLKGDPLAKELAGIPKNKLRQIIYAYFDAAIALCADGNSVQMPRSVNLNVRAFFMKKKAVPIVCFDASDPLYSKIVPNYEKYRGLTISETYNLSNELKPKKDWESKVNDLILLLKYGYSYTKAKREVKFYEYQKAFLTEEQIQRITNARNDKTT